MLWAMTTAWFLILAVVQRTHQRKKPLFALRLSNAILELGNGLLVLSLPWVVRQRTC